MYVNTHHMHIICLHNCANSHNGYCMHYVSLEVVMSIFGRSLVYRHIHGDLAVTTDVNHCYLAV
jgi:hypothetical protein